jgi:hypothetical protein
MNDDLGFCNSRSSEASALDRKEPDRVPSDLTICWKIPLDSQVKWEDLGMQARPFFSTKMWRPFLLPNLKKRWPAAKCALDHCAPHVKIILHSEGAINPYRLIGNCRDTPYIWG